MEKNSSEIYNNEEIVSNFLHKIIKNNCGAA